MAQAGDIKFNIDLLPLSRLGLALEVHAERNRQVIAEGYGPAHDDQHSHGELADAAACYAAGSASLETGSGRSVWPRIWAYKPKDRRRDLIRAGALILAELERLDRAHG